MEKEITHDYGTSCLDCERYKRLGDVCAIEHEKKFLWDYCRDFVSKIELPDYKELMKTVKNDQALARKKAKEKKDRERKKKLKERLVRKEEKRKKRRARLRRIREKKKKLEEKQSERLAKKSTNATGSTPPKTRARKAASEKIEAPMSEAKSEQA